jgi:hypothetical protein
VVEWGDKEGFAFARMPLGAGSIDIVATLDPARQPSLLRDHNTPHSSGNCCSPTGTAARSI